jgi:hypothetical protein
VATAAAGRAEDVLAALDRAARLSTGPHRHRNQQCGGRTDDDGRVRPIPTTLRAAIDACSIADHAPENSTRVASGCRFRGTFDRRPARLMPAGHDAAIGLI